MIRHGQLWRLLTSIFPHVSIMHLVFNIYWLWVFGTLVEEKWGHLKAAALIVLFAAIPSGLEYAFASGGVGLSGVGYGLLGLLWVLSRRDERFRDAVDGRTVGLFVIWFFVCILLTVSNVMPVGNIAHGVSAVLGMMVGFAITHPNYRWALTSATTILLAFTLWAATLGRPKVNFSQLGPYEECSWGYQALAANHDQEALRWLEDSVQYRKAPSLCRSNLAVAQERLKNYKVAFDEFRKAAEGGDDFAAFSLGGIYDSGIDGVIAKDQKEAVRWYRKAVDLGSNDALNNLAWAYATSDDPEIRNPKSALEYAKKAVAAEKDPERPSPMVLDTLAESQYVNGLFKEAIDTEKRAIGLAKEDEKETYKLNLVKYESSARKTQLISEKRNVQRAVE